MKKIYICALALFLGNLSFAQQITPRTFTKSSLQTSVNNGLPSAIGDIQANYKAPGDVIWSEDFTNGLPKDWKVVDNTNKGYKWVINSDSISNTSATPPGFTDAGAIKSKSGGKHMLIFGDEYNRLEMANTGKATDLDSYFQTAAISVKNMLGVSVNFQQKFRQCCAINPSPVVVLIASKDPNFKNNVKEYDIIGGVAGNVQSADPMNMSINISAIAANYDGKIYLRFHIKSGTSHYYWMIDDIEVVESQTNDIVASAGSAHFYGVEYSRIPKSQIQPMSASMIYTNNGTQTQTKSNLTVTINDGTTSVVKSTPNIDIPSLKTDTIKWDSLWTPAATVGKEYTVTLDIKSEDIIDSSPSNNTQTMPPFSITDGIMALDDYSMTPGSSGASNSIKNKEYEVGNQFDCTASAPLYAIEVVTGAGTPAGTIIDAVLYSRTVVNQTEVFTEVWRSKPYTTTTNDINTPKKFYDIGGKPIFNMIKGATYIAAVHSYINYRYATSGFGPLPGTPTARHSFIRYPNIANPNANSDFNLTVTPMIRLDLKPTSVGIEEGKATTNFSVYPNPSNGQFRINFSKEMRTALISVKNMIGQTILDKTVNVSGKKTETISLANYSKGVYFLTVNDETVKLIIE